MASEPRAYRKKIIEKLVLEVGLRRGFHDQRQIGPVVLGRDSKSGGKAPDLNRAKLPGFRGVGHYFKTVTDGRRVAACKPDVERPSERCGARDRN